MKCKSLFESNRGLIPIRSSVNASYAESVSEPIIRTDLRGMDDLL